jgi:hypothetical protein
MCRRIAAAGEFLSLAGWREDAGFRVFYFTTWAKARAMQHWINRSGIARRPMPKLGLSAADIAEQDREALTWGLETGAVRFTSATAASLVRASGALTSDGLARSAAARVR